MRVAIRTDSSARIGGGHVGRCLALAQALDSRGHEIRFVCRDLPGSLTPQIAAAGFSAAILSGDAGEDAAATLAALADFSPDWVVVDSYALDAMWERTLRATGCRVLVIDDLADRPHDCDVLIDVNRVDATDYHGLVPAGARLLLGPRFALLRREFAEARGADEAGETAPSANALFFFGAADGTGMIERSLDALERIPGRDFVAHVVVTAANTRRQAIVERCRTMAGVICHDSVADMAMLISSMGFAVGGGGTTLWERCCLGLPTLAVCLVNNQRLQLATATDLGLVRFAGDVAEMTVERLAAAIGPFAADEKGRAALRRAGRIMVDGLGADRVAALVDPLVLTPATADDTKMVWEWANDPDVRSNSFSPDPILFDSHKAWFARRLADPRCRIFIATRDGAPVGQVRFECEGPHAVIDISVASAMRGRGFGSLLLLRAVERYHAEFPAMGLTAEIKHGNLASRAMFRAAGFRPATPLRPEAARVILEFPAR